MEYEGDGDGAGAGGGCCVFKLVEEEALSQFPLLMLTVFQLPALLRDWCQAVASFIEGMTSQGSNSSTMDRPYCSSKSSALLLPLLHLVHGGGGLDKLRGVGPKGLRVALENCLKSHPGLLGELPAIASELHACVAAPPGSALLQERAVFCQAVSRLVAFAQLLELAAYAVEGKRSALLQQLPAYHAALSAALGAALAVWCAEGQAAPKSAPLQAAVEAWQQGREKDGLDALQGLLAPSGDDSLNAYALAARGLRLAYKLVLVLEGAHEGGSCIRGAAEWFGYYTGADGVTWMSFSGKGNRGQP